MNTTRIITSVAGISLLLATAVPALAREGSDDVSVSADANASGEVKLNDVMPHLPFKVGFPNLRVGSTSGRVEGGEHASTTREDRGDKEHASSTEKRMEKATEKAGDAIDKRIKSLTELIARLGQIKLLSADQLASITATLNAEIQSLTELKAKIGSDSATTTLKADVKSITQDERVFMLVEPKARIAAAASRVNAVVTQFTSLTTKLQERITAAQAAGANVSAAASAMTDLNAKLADAKVQADAAVSLTANLKADGGDKTVAAANKAALTQAREKLVLAQKDLAAARHDVATVYSVVKGKGGVEGEVHATTTTP